MRSRVEAAIALRRALDAELHGVPEMTVLPSQANSILVRTPLPARLVFDSLLAHGVLVEDVSPAAPLDRCLRITIGTASENARCVQALRDAQR